MAAPRGMLCLGPVGFLPGYSRHKRHKTNVFKGYTQVGAFSVLGKNRHYSFGDLVNVHRGYDGFAVYQGDTAKSVNYVNGFGDSRKAFLEAADSHKMETFYV